MGILRQKPRAGGKGRPLRARHSALPRVVLGVPLVAVGLGACGASPVEPTPVAPARAVPAAEVETFDRDWAERTLWSVPLRVRLPEARAWHASASGTFTLLEHPATRSTLTLRVTLAPRLVRPHECEADARLARPSLPSMEASSIVEQRTLRAPAGFDVRLVVGVEPADGGVHGYALAVGAATSRCYVAAFETRSTGARAAEHVADRLAVVVSGILETMSVPNADARASPPMGVK